MAVLMLCQADLADWSSEIDRQEVRKELNLDLIIIFSLKQVLREAVQ
jgi:hypothetical protein